MDIEILVASQLSQQLKSLRKTHKLTQKQLAVLLGVGQARIAHIEKDPGAISVAQLLALLTALDTRLLLRPVSHKPGKPTKW